jgi:hypothetical protein
MMLRNFFGTDGIFGSLATLSPFAAYAALPQLGAERRPVEPEGFDLTALSWIAPNERRHSR